MHTSRYARHEGVKVSSSPDYEKLTFVIFPFSGVAQNYPELDGPFRDPYHRPEPSGQRGRPTVSLSWRFVVLLPRSWWPLTCLFLHRLQDQERRERNSVPLSQKLEQMRERNRINSLQYRRERRKENEGQSSALFSFFSHFFPSLHLMLLSFFLCLCVCLCLSFSLSLSHSSRPHLSIAWVGLAERLQSVQREQDALAIFMRSISPNALATDQWISLDKMNFVSSLNAAAGQSSDEYSSDEEDSEGAGGSGRRRRNSEPTPKRSRRGHAI